MKGKVKFYFQGHTCWYSLRDYQIATGIIKFEDTPEHQEYMKKIKEGDCVTPSYRRHLT